MTYFLLILGLPFAILLAALTTSMILIHNRIPAVLLFFVILLVLPPVSRLLHNGLRLSIHPAIRAAAIVLLRCSFSTRPG